jgi:hypothetical protein
LFFQAVEILKSMKTLPITSPYGSWKSPITAESIVATSIGLGSVWVDGGDIYWLEKRPQEKGRNVIVSYTEDKIVEITPPAYSVRTRVHEYGGGAFIVVDRTIYFSNYSDGQICRQSLGDRPQALTSDGQKRYADLIVDRNHNRLLCICEGLTLPSQGRACLPPFEGKHPIVGCTPRQQHGGYLTILDAPRDLKPQLDLWGYRGNALSMMQALARQFDPQQILNPGRLI